MNAIEQPKAPPERGQSGPTPEQLAAIIAAVEVAWPRPVIVADDDRDQPSPWRFSNRWWTPRRSPVSSRVRP